MKIILLLATLFTSTLTYARPAVFCSLYHSDRVLEIAKKHSTYDKNRHCTVSCMLTLKCPADEVLLVGTLKEVKDFFGPGEASVADLEADAFGISLAFKGAARSDKQCLSQCDLYYSK